jgi:hypothetical protein
MLLAACIAAAPLMFVLAAVAQEKKPAAPPAVSGADIETKAAKSRGEGKDENIKNDRRPNDPNAPRVPPPPGKGGEKSRQPYCPLHIDNHTGWIVDCYGDGSYVGSMAAWGDLYFTNLSGGRVILYCTAPGTPYSWGPVSGSCGTWTLRE